MNTKVAKIILHCITATLVITSAVTAYADQIKPLLDLSPTLAHIWPFILIGASLLDKIGSGLITAFYKPVQVTMTDGEQATVQATNVTPAVKLLIACIGLSFAMSFFVACSTTQQAAFSDWFTSPGTQATLKAAASITEQIGLQYAENRGIISEADAANITGIISSVRQLESTPQAGNVAAIKQTVIDNTSGVNAQALADAFARGYAIARSKAPDAPATAILEAAVQAFPVGVDKAVANNNANP